MATGAHGDRIAIVMATYNGAPNLSAQIDSILAQDHGNWRLIVRDDGSADGTVDILRAYAARHEEKISLITDDLGNLGPAANFSRLLEIVNAPYVALCDQDDVWLPDKLSRSLTRMQALEAAHGARAPCLIYTDLIVADRTLKQVAPSFWDRMGIRPDRDWTLDAILTGNQVTGCTMLLNHPLRDLVTPIPCEACMHDWWIALCAVALGKAEALAEPTVLYRVHGANAVGAPRPSLTSVKWFSRGLNERQHRILRLIPQALAFRHRFAGRLSAAQSGILDTILGLPRLGFWDRLSACRRLEAFSHRPLHMTRLALLMGHEVLAPYRGDLPGA